jgi:hypothetical protein
MGNDYSFFIIETIRVTKRKMPELTIPDIIYSALSQLKVKNVKDIRSVNEEDLYKAFHNVVERETEIY